MAKVKRKKIAQDREHVLVRLPADLVQYLDRAADRSKTSRNTALINILEILREFETNFPKEFVRSAKPEHRVYDMLAQLSEKGAMSGLVHYFAEEQILRVWEAYRGIVVDDLGKRFFDAEIAKCKIRLEALKDAFDDEFCAEHDRSLDEQQERSGNQ